MLHHNKTQQSAHETHVLSPWRREIRHPDHPLSRLNGSQCFEDHLTWHQEFQDLKLTGISDDQYQSEVKTQVSQNGLALYIEIER